MSIYRDRIDNCLIELELTNQSIYNDLKELYVGLYLDFELKREINLSLTMIKIEVDNRLNTLKLFKQINNMGLEITDTEIIEIIIEYRQKIYNLVFTGMQSNINEEKVDLYYSTDEDEQPMQTSIKLKLSEIKREIESCPICHEKYADSESLIILECRHAFHEECFNKWRKNSCPCCRK
jgi:hypothetical protein